MSRVTNTGSDPIDATSRDVIMRRLGGCKSRSSASRIFAGRPRFAAARGRPKHRAGESSKRVIKFTLSRGIISRNEKSPRE